MNESDLNDLEDAMRGFPNDIKANPCPFCKSKIVNVVDCSPQDFCVECSECFSRGPADITDRLAIKKWNKSMSEYPQWVIRLYDRADGCKNHFCVGRLTNGGYHEFWSESAGKFCSAGTVYVGRDAEEKLKSFTPKENFNNPYGSVENLWNQLKRTEDLMDCTITEKTSIIMDIIKAETLEECKSAIGVISVVVEDCPECGFPSARRDGHFKCSTADCNYQGDYKPGDKK